MYKRQHLPNAVEKIAFDRFHVAKQLGEVVDKTRQNEHPHLPVESRRQAKGTRFLWQYSDKWMTESRPEKLMWLREKMQQTSQCWTLKELAKNIWDRPWSTERLSLIHILDVAARHRVQFSMPESDAVTMLKNRHA